MAQLEFETKFVLHRGALPLIESEIAHNKYGQVTFEQIWQCYGYKKSRRFRATINPETHEARYTREVKKSLKLSCPFSANLEDDEEITRDDFLREYGLSERQVTKLRWTVTDFTRCLGEDFGREHQLMIDLFVVPKNSYGLVGELLPSNGYCLMAEVEALVNVNTTHVDFNFRLPLFMRPFCLKQIDARIADSKLYSSVNLHNAPDNVAGVRDMIKRLVK